MKVKELLSDESKWTKGTAARNINGIPCGTHDSCASSFCLIGAVGRCYPYPTAGRIFDRISGYIHDPLVARWNDAPERTFSDVKKLVNELDI